MSYLDSGFDNNLIRTGYSAEESGQYDIANISEIIGVGSIPVDSISLLDKAMDGNGSIITDLINARLDTSSKYILSDFNFGAVNYAGAVKTGDLAWNTSTGAITGGSGVAIYRNGIIGAAAGVTTFSINATTGAAVFAGSLTAATGTLGALTIASGGNIKFGKTAYTDDTNAGLWLGDVSGVAKLNIGSGATKYLHYDGTDFTLLGGTIYGGNIYASSSGSSGNVHLYVGAYGGQCDVEYGGQQKGFYAADSATTILGSANGNKIQINSVDSLNCIADSWVQMVYNDDGGSDNWQVVNDATVAMELSDGMDLWVNNNVSAASFTDRTPAYVGNALAELKKITSKKDKDGKDEIDHDTLPTFVKREMTSPNTRDKITGEIIEYGVVTPLRDLGAMVSMLSVAIGQLDDKIEALKIQ